MSSVIITTIPTDSQVEDIVVRLKEKGTPEHDLSVVVRDGDGSEVGDGAVDAPIVGSLTAAAVLVIPGLGRYVAAGPLLATLSGVAVGATLGGIAGALRRLGIPEAEAQACQTRLLEGNLLLAVHCDDAARVGMVCRIFEQGGAHAIHVASRGAW